MEDLRHPVNIFWLCVALHLVADYCLQGILCDMKQKRWWHDQIAKEIRNHPNNTFQWQYKIYRKYKYDYLAGLACHAIMWSIITFLPLLLVCTPYIFTGIVLVNSVIHMVVDHMKANTHHLNLWQDQLIHLVQVAATVFIVAL